MIVKFDITTPPGSPFPKFSVIYTEPTTKADGSPITNLAFISVLYEIDGRVTPAAVVSAISPTGGEESSWLGYVAVQPRTKKTVTIWTTATDSNGDESDRSETFTFIVDRTGTINVSVPPAPPT